MRRVAIITGSSRGLGRQTAARFARGGWNVLVNCVRERDLAESVVDEVRAAGADAAVVVADVSDAATPRLLIDEAVRRWGRLDCLVNNAGVLNTASLLKLTEADWDRVIEVDLLAAMRMARAAAGAMAAGGSVVNLISMCAMWGCPSLVHYSAAKAGLAGFTVGFAAEAAGRGVRVNAVAPGFLQTDMAAERDEPMERARQLHAMKRLSDPAGAAEFIFRLTTEMPHVTGRLFTLDGRIR